MVFLLSSTPITMYELFLGLLFDSAQICFKNFAFPSLLLMSILRFLS